MSGNNTLIQESVWILLNKPVISKYCMPKYKITLRNAAIPQQNCYTKKWTDFKSKLYKL